MMVVTAPLVFRFRDAEEGNLIPKHPLSLDRRGLLKIIKLVNELKLAQAPSPDPDVDLTACAAMLDDAILSALQHSGASLIPEYFAGEIESFVKDVSRGQLPCNPQPGIDV